MMIECFRRKLAQAKVLRVLALAIVLGEMALLGGCDGKTVRVADADAKDTANAVPLLILDGDFGSSTDDLFALLMALNYEREGKCRLLGVVNDRGADRYAAIPDLMLTYFGRSDVPIGQEHCCEDTTILFIDYVSMTQFRRMGGEPMFPRSLQNYAALPDGWKLYRHLLAGQADHSVSVCLLGFPTALSHLLESQPDKYSPLNGVDLVRKKVAALYVMGGHWGEGRMDGGYNLVSMPKATEDFFHLWPKEVTVYFSPSIVGQGINYERDSVIRDISWTDFHPIKQIYVNYDCNTGQCMWDILPVMQAVEGNDRFSLSEPGYVNFVRVDSMPFVPDSLGNCRYQLAGDKGWNEAVLRDLRKVTVNCKGVEDEEDCDD